MRLFRKGKTHIIAKYLRTDLVICSHSREAETPSYSRINTVYKIYIDELLNILKSKHLRLKIGTVYNGSIADVAHLASSAEELQLMLQESVRFACKNRYNIHPTKTCIVVLYNHIPDKNYSWKLGENTVRLSDSSLYLRGTHAGKKECE